MRRDILMDTEGGMEGVGGAASASALPQTAPSELDDLKRALADIHREIKQKPATQTTPPAQPQQAFSLEQANKDFYQNPVGNTAAIAQAQVGQALGQVMAQNAATMAQVVRDKVRSTDPAIFDTYVAEVEEIINTHVHPTQRGNMDVWQATFDNVKGKHLNDIIKMKAKAAVPTTTKDGPSSSGTKPPPPASTEPELSDEEKVFVRKWNTTPEGYREGKKAYDNQSETGSSSWDPVLTFSSEDRRRAARRATATAQR
jgi:hypothetical protein